MARERRSLQDRIRDRQQSSFVGRKGQVVQFRENLGLPVDDDRRSFLFNIHGDAGVGKTFLTRQFQQIASGGGALTAYVDETVEDVASAMAVIAAQFGRCGSPLAEFEKRAADYRKRRHELESDPNAPEGIASFLTKSAVRISLAAAREVPVAGALVAPVNAAAAADQVDRAREYLARRFGDHSDVRLLLSPADELSPVLVAGINRAAAARQVVLFFDAYERTGPLLDHWLRGMYDGRYGDLPETLIAAISGQIPLDPNLWGDYLPVVADMSLEPFSEAEARQFLASKHIADETTTQVIVTLSGRLPLWLATLADARPHSGADTGDPAGNAVDRFLKWENDPERREIAVTAALPRFLNQDTLAAVAPADKAREMFRWLRGLPFVSQRAGSWTYHEVVRAAMLRLRRAEAPGRWRSDQIALAEANASWANQTAGSARNAWGNPDWIDYAREETYHRLCADPVSNLPSALATAVKAAEHSIIRARQWAVLIADAGRDANNAVLREWGQRLDDGIHDSDLSQYFTHLINDGNLDQVALVAALGERGTIYRLTGRYDEALADFNLAIKLRPSRAWAIASRGETYRLMGRHDEALGDFNSALEFNPAYGWALDSRGVTYLAMGRYDAALADFSRSIALDPSDEWTLASRGEANRRADRYDEALADFNRALELDSGYVWALVSRGRTYLAACRYDEALADLGRAVEIDPDNAWGLAWRGEAHRLLARYGEALADFDRAIEIDPGYAEALGDRGQVYLAMGR